MNHPCHLLDDDSPLPPSSSSSNSWWTSILLSSSQSQHPPSASTITELADSLNWSSDSSTAINDDTIPSTTGAAVAMDSSLPIPTSLSTDTLMWNHLLSSCGSAYNEAMQNLSVEDLQDVLFSRVLRQAGNELLVPDQNKMKVEEMPTWDLIPPPSFTFQGDDNNMENKSISSSNFQCSQLVDSGDKLSSNTCKAQDTQRWSATLAGAAAHSTSLINSFTPALELSSCHFEHGCMMNQDPSVATIKQEWPSSQHHLQTKHNLSFQGGSNEYSRNKQFPNTSSTSIGGPSAPYWLQGFAGLEQTYKGDASSQESFLRTLTATSNFSAPTVHDELSGLKWRAGLQSSRFTHPAQFSQRTSVPLSNQAAGMLSVRARQAAMESSALRSGFKPHLHGIATDLSSSLQYAQQSTERKPLHDASSRLGTTRPAEEVRSTMLDPKRSAGSISSSKNTSESLLKRPRLEAGPPTHPYKPQVKKEKLGDRITALQQLVSPFGKTDTASVLLEAIGYIKFLQEQVQVLSTPYMKTTSTTTTHADGGKKNNQSDSDEPKLDLRSRGLCLVPVSCTMHVANENGAEFWSPSLTGAGFR